MRRLATVAALAGALALPSAAYYHYLHYPSRTGTGFPEKFDVSALPNKTVTVFVSDAGPNNFAPNDSFASVLSQVRQAALAWNSVESSDLRVAFGGLIQSSATPASPGIQVAFGEVPPGVLAFTVPVASPAPVAAPNGPFFPLQRSIVTFRRDLSVPPGPSYLDSFFTTAVHEFGHTLGLQHTFTASAMTVAVNRNINRSRPLDADDIAGLSLLYPKAGYLSSVGAISGRVTANGQPVGMASVVALRPAGAAISTLSNPDGTYRIDGLPADTYYVYAHPLPPDAADAGGIRLPVDLAGQAFPGATAFATGFYPNNARDLSQFQPINVTRGATVGGIDFAVQPRSSVPVWDGEVFSYFGQTGIKPAFVNSTSGQATVVFRASPSTPVPQGVQIPGIGNVQVQTYGNPLNLAIYLPLGAGTGPRHLLINLAGNDMYVLPSALYLVQKQPPQNVAITPTGDNNVLVTGAYMGQDSRVFFDGLPAAVRVPFTGGDAAGAIQVTPPSGFGGQRATVTVFNADGQSSMFLQSANPPVYLYPPAPAPQVFSSFSSLPAGASALVEVNGSNTNFIDGQVTLGFGTHDVFVRRLWVLSPNRLFANVLVLPGATPGATEISVISGFQTVVQPFAFVTQPANPALPSVALPVSNTATNQANIFPGATVAVSGTNLSLTPASATVTLLDATGNAYPTQVVSATPGQVTFAIPAGMPTGVATLRLYNGSDSAFPVAIQIDSQPPVIAGVLNGSGLPLDATRSAGPGEVLILTVTGLDPAVVSDHSGLRVSAAGIDLPITQIQPAAQAGALQIQVVVTQYFGGQSVPLTVTQDGTVSNPYTVVIR